MKGIRMIRTAFVMAVTMLTVACGMRNSKSTDQQKDGKLQYTAQVNMVETMTLVRRDFARQLLSNGKLRASKRSSLYFGTSGTIASVSVRNGQYVQAGARIAALERPDLQLSLESARLALRKAELELYDYLVGQGYQAADTSSVPPALMATARMKSGYDVARNSLSRAEFELSGTVLNAPFAGRVVDCSLNTYDRIGSESFCSIVDDRLLEVDFTVMESEYSFLEVGLPVKIRPFADSEKVYTGKIIDINPLVDSRGQVRVRAEFTNDGSLIDGMNVKVIVERLMPNQLVVPRSAVVIRDNLDVLFTYTPDGKAHWQYVTILYENGEDYVVEAKRDRNAALNEGDEVIISGNLNLADNSEVILKQ